MSLGMGLKKGGEVGDGASDILTCKIPAKFQLFIFQKPFLKIKSDPSSR